MKKICLAKRTISFFFKSKQIDSLIRDCTLATICAELQETFV